MTHLLDEAQGVTTFDNAPAAEQALAEAGERAELIDLDTHCTCQHKYDADSTHCDECHRTWTGHGEHHCRRCHRSFSSIRIFDAHLVDKRDGSIEHRDPPKLNSKGNPTGWKLVERRSGKLWATEMDEKRLQQLTGKRKSKTTGTTGA